MLFPKPGPLPTAPAALELVSDGAEGAGSHSSQSSSQSPGKNQGTSGQWRVPTSRGGGAASKRGFRERWGPATRGTTLERGRCAESRTNSGFLHRRRRRFRRLQGGVKRHEKWGCLRGQGHGLAAGGFCREADVLRSAACPGLPWHSIAAGPELGGRCGLDAPAGIPAWSREAEVTVAGLGGDPRDSSPLRESDSRIASVRGGGGEAAGRRHRPGSR